MNNMDKNSDKKAGPSGYWAGILLYTLAWFSVLSTIFPIPVTVRDSGNNLIQGATVVLSSNRGATDTFTQPVGTTDANGQITGAVKSVTSGNATISAGVNARLQKVA